MCLESDIENLFLLLSLYCIASQQFEGIIPYQIILINLNI